MKISIITATFNSEKYIGNLIESIRFQSYGDYEWIVVDGLSSDNTINIVEKSGINNIQCVSEEDSGVYSALNKGIKMAKGDYLYFIGSDDKFVDNNVLSDISIYLNDDRCCVFGSVLDGRGVVFNSSLGWKTNVINTVHHQSAFYAKKLFVDFVFDEQIRAVSDYELNFKLARFYRDSCFICGRFVAICGAGGISNSGSEISNYKDMNVIRKKYIGRFASYIFYFIGVCNLILRRL